MKLIKRFDSWVDRRMIDLYEGMGGDHEYAKVMREENKKGKIVGYSHSTSTLKKELKE